MHKLCTVLNRKFFFHSNWFDLKLIHKENRFQYLAISGKSFWNVNDIPFQIGIKTIFFDKFFVLLMKYVLAHFHSYSSLWFKTANIPGPTNKFNRLKNLGKHFWNFLFLMDFFYSKHFVRGTLDLQFFKNQKYFSSAYFHQFSFAWRKLRLVVHTQCNLVYNM